VPDLGDRHQALGPSTLPQAATSHNVRRGDGDLKIGEVIRLIWSQQASCPKADRHRRERAGHQVSGERNTRWPCRAMRQGQGSPRIICVACLDRWPREKISSNDWSRTWSAEA